MPTATFNETSNGGYVVSYSVGLSGALPDYDAAREGTGDGKNVSYVSDLQIFAGQDYYDGSPSDSLYWCQEIFLEFPLESIPPGSTITYVLLEGFKEFVTGDGLPGYSLEFRQYDFGPSLTTGDYVPGSYLTSHTMVGTLVATTTDPAETYESISNESTNFETVVAASAGGKLRLIAHSTRLRSGDAPTGHEYLGFGTNLYDSNPWRLTITWTEPAVTEPMIFHW